MRTHGAAATLFIERSSIDPVATHGGAMNATDHDQPDTDRPLTSRLHPRVYAVVIGLAAWFALAVWGFAGSGLVDYLLFIVSGFVFVAVVLPLIMSRVGRTAAKTDDKPPTFRDWAALDFDTQGGRLSGVQAATMILLPLAAAAVGMTAFAIAFHIAEHSA
jgi:hypothetical protein